MRLWQALYAALASLSSQWDRIEGLERLTYPVLFRDDTGACFLIKEGREFRDFFEAQDLLDTAHFGWDSRHYVFRFQYSSSRKCIVVDFGAQEPDAMEAALA